MKIQNMSIDQLRQALSRKSKRLNDLMISRRECERSLKSLDKEIILLKGNGSNNGLKKTRVSVKNTKSLIEHIRDLFKKSGPTLSLQSITRGVLNNGYKTSSENFHSRIASCISFSKEFTNVSRGVYSIKKPMGKKKIVVKPSVKNPEEKK